MNPNDVIAETDPMEEVPADSYHGDLVHKCALLQYEIQQLKATLAKHRQICQNCKYIGEQWGDIRCTFHAPKDGGWPIVDPGYSCGDFRPREDLFA